MMRLMREEDVPNQPAEEDCASSSSAPRSARRRKSDRSASAAEIARLRAPRGCCNHQSSQPPGRNVSLEGAWSDQFDVPYPPPSRRPRPPRGDDRHAARPRRRRRPRDGDRQPPERPPRGAERDLDPLAGIGTDPTVMCTAEEDAGGRLFGGGGGRHGRKGETGCRDRSLPSLARSAPVVQRPLPAGCTDVTQARPTRS